MEIPPNIYIRPVAPPEKVKDESEPGSNDRKFFKRLRRIEDLNEQMIKEKTALEEMRDQISPEHQETLNAILKKGIQP